MVKVFMMITICKWRVMIPRTKKLRLAICRQAEDICKKCTQCTAVRKDNDDDATIFIFHRLSRKLGRRNKEKQQPAWFLLCA